MKTKKTSLIAQDKVFGIIAAVTALILLVPLVAMQFSSEVQWGISDFFIIGTLIFGTTSIFVLIARRIKQKYWLPLGILFGILLLWAWAELAVGIFTNLGS